MGSLQNIAEGIRQELQDEDATNYSDPEVHRQINYCVKSLARKVASKWPDFWLMSGEAYATELTLVSGTESYSIDEDFYKVIAVDFPGCEEPYPSLDLPGSMKSDAVGYLLVRNPDTDQKNIVFYPTPGDELADETVTVYQIILPDKVTDETKKVPLSGYFEDLIVQMTAMRLKIRSNRNPEGLAFIQQYVKGELDQLITGTNRPENFIMERGTEQDFI